MPRTRDPEWLADVRLPGPNDRVFKIRKRHMQAEFLASNIMEDDTDTTQFTPGCVAYAGYSYGRWANMTKVRAYAASQGARSFAYTGFISHLAGADALDIEPTLAVASDAPIAYRAGIRKFYMSASQTATVKSHLVGAGIDLATCKFISAHYSGPHICGPKTCGYPQADATQFTDRYMGRILDATLLGPDFWGAPVPTPPVTHVKVPNCYGQGAGHAHNTLVGAQLHPVAVASQTSSMICTATAPTAGTTVAARSGVTIIAGSAPTLSQNNAPYVSWVKILQTDLNKASAGLTVDGVFGPRTHTAVEAYQQRHGLGVDGIVGPLTWASLGAR